MGNRILFSNMPKLQRQMFYNIGPRWQPLIQYKFLGLGSGSSTVVDDSPLHPKVKVSSLSGAAGTTRECSQESFLNFYEV